MIIVKEKNQSSLYLDLPSSCCCNASVDVNLESVAGLGGVQVHMLPSVDAADDRRRLATLNEKGHEKRNLSNRFRAP